MYLLITAVVLAFCAGCLVGTGVAIVVLGLCRAAEAGDRARYEGLALGSTAEHAPY